MSPLETLPTVWDDVRDTAFFTLVAREFSASFACGTSVLLASYDEDLAPATAPTPIPVSRPDEHLVPVPARINR